MEVKIIIAALSLAFGLLLLVLSSVLIHRQSREGFLPVEIRFYFSQSFYDGSMGAYALALVAALCHIIFFVWANLTSDKRMPRAGAHVLIGVLALVACILGIVYEIHQDPMAEIQSVTQRSRYTAGAEESLYRINMYGAHVFGTAFIVITGIDTVFCIGTAFVSFLWKEL